MNTFKQVREIIDVYYIQGEVTDEQLIEVQKFCEDYLDNYHYLPEDIYEFYCEIL